MKTTKKSNLVKIMERLKVKIPKGDKIEYTVPDLWNCFDYSGEEKKINEDGTTFVNPYKFYYECINKLVSGNYDEEIDYSLSLSRILNSEMWGMGGDWIKASSMYAMQVRTSTSWDHNNSGKLEDENEYGMKETGTFLKSIALLPLLNKMGINTIYMLPISMNSTKFKKGEMGSPYAVKNFFKLDPNLKDPMIGDDITIEEEFGAFVEACHILGMRVMIDIIPKTAGRDNDLILEHPEWFYWVRTKDIPYYNPPRVQGVGENEKPSYENLHLLYESQEVWDLIKKFCPSPDQIDKEKWESIVTRCKEDSSLDFFELIQDEFEITTAPAFSDCMNDPQPAWTDVTYLRYYLDHPVASRQYMQDPYQAPYIMHDTIKTNLFKGDIKNQELWNMVSDIIPYYQNTFGIDGARIDMGHALPDELVDMLIWKPREIDPDFSIIAEEFYVSEAEKCRNKGYNMIIGYGWWMEPRIFEHKTHEFMYGARDFKAPVFACAETPDTPRIAARDGGRVLSKLVTIMNQFVPNGVPFTTSGLEIYETQPMNTGLDCRPDERYRLSPDDPYLGKLAFFDKYCFHWNNPYRWDMPDTMENVSKIRNQYLDTITNLENFVPIGCTDPTAPVIALTYIMQGKRWRQSDNILMAVCNTDLYCDREYTLELRHLRYLSGNDSRKAWLAYSANEWSHDIYDFDENWNLNLKFKPGEVKILIM